MAESAVSSEASDKRLMGRPIFVSVGIALFVVGFLVTAVFSAAGSVDRAGISAIEMTDSNGGDSLTFENLMAFLGVFVGLLGVVTATVGPLTTVVISKRRR